MNKQTFLAFDFGASSGRAILGSIEHGIMMLTEVHRFANGPKEIDGALFWDFDHQIAEIKNGIRKALATGEKITSIAIDTWGVDYVLFKKDGTPVRLPYHYRDNRTDGIPEQVFKKIPEAEIYRRTGIQLMQLNTIYQLYAHHQQHPEDFRDATLLMIPDAMTYMLCGAKTCEYTEASTSNLLDAATGEWDFELIKKLGLPKSIFPEIVKPCTTAGVLLPELQQELGCGPIPVFKVGSHDTASAVASVPAPHKGEWAYISCGTWALLGAELKHPSISEATRQVPLTNEGGLNGTIRFLTNIMGTWLMQETRRVWNDAGRTIGFPDIIRMAMESKPGQYFVDPNDHRFLPPGDMPARVRELCGKPAMTDAEACRCLYDSLALCFRQKIEKLQKLLGVKYACLNIVGGGTRDALLMQLTADALGIPVVAGPIEATAAGNIMAQAITAGIIADVTAGREIVKKSFDVVTYQPASDRGWWDNVKF